jgi:hypothetical protein
MSDVTRLVGEIRGETPPPEPYDPPRPIAEAKDERSAS